MCVYVCVEGGGGGHFEVNWLYIVPNAEGLSLWWYVMSSLLTEAVYLANVKLVVEYNATH